MSACKNEDECRTPTWCRGKDQCQSAKSELAAMPCSVTPEMVKAALDEYVQYTLPTYSDDWRADTRKALQAIAAHINKSLNAAGEATSAKKPQDSTL